MIKKDVVRKQFEEMLQVCPLLESSMTFNFKLWAKNLGRGPELNKSSSLAY